MNLREARPEERTAIVELTLSAYAQYAAEITPEGFDLYMRHIRHTLETDDRPIYLVAEQDGQLAASVLLYPPYLKIYSDLPNGSAYPEVRLLAVSPNFRRKGVGRLLMEECMHRAKAMGAEGVGLHTSDMMAGAVALYTEMGFQRHPEMDFSPDPALIVKGFLLRF
jgi:GNAT superfamily N-acetyltransferase